MPLVNLKTHLIFFKEAIITYIIQDALMLLIAIPDIDNPNKVIAVRAITV